VIKEAAGRYFASFVVETTCEPLPPAEAETGIDLGLTYFAVLSNGRKIASPKFLRRAERKLRKAQKALSRKAKGSRNRDKARVTVARVHAKVADARRDWLHKESTRIIRENQAVYVEDLCVAGLARTRLAKSVHEHVNARTGLSRAHRDRGGRPAGCSTPRPVARTGSGWTARSRAGPR